MQDPWISLRDLWIPSSRRNPWIAQKSVDRAGYNLPVLQPDLTLISLLWINIARQVAVCDWWTILEVSALYETHVSNNSNFTATTCRDAVFHTTPTPTVCYSVPSIVEVSGGCQSVNICLHQRGIAISEMSCILRKIHRLRKHPWISAQTMDPQIAQADPWIAQIHRLRPTYTAVHWHLISHIKYVDHLLLLSYSFHPL